MDSFDGDAGRDSIDFGIRAHFAISVDLGAGVATSATRDDTLVSIFDVSGTRFDDQLVGSAGPDRLGGGGGADRLSGGAGKDRMFGGEDDDVLRGGSRLDQLRGNEGRDRFYARDGEADALFGGIGRDRARIDLSLDTIELVESLF